MKQTDWEAWQKAWKNVGRIVLWGYGKNCRLHLQELKRGFEIEAIIDSNQAKMAYKEEGIPILSPDFSYLQDKKIVITTHYEEVRRQLQEAGLREFIDFCEIRLFVSGKAWMDAGQVVLSEVHIAVTTGCTLNCRYCNMYMPFHKKQTWTLPLEHFKKQLKLLFSYVDRVINLVLIGGETLLYQELAEAIEYTGEHFSSQIGTIGIVTNGTVKPTKRQADMLRKWNVLVSMSNYHLNENYNKAFAEQKQLFRSGQIRFCVNPNLVWKDFAFPYESLELTDEEAYQNMDSCNPVFRGFNDSKLYFCHLVWSADKAGIWKEEKTDYLDLSKPLREGREKIVRMNICCHGEGYNSLCRLCAGCSDRNQRIVPVGGQA